MIKANQGPWSGLESRLNLIDLTLPSDFVYTSVSCPPSCDHLVVMVPNILEVATWFVKSLP